MKDNKKSTGKPSIILYTDHLRFIKELSLEDRGTLLTALMNYAETRALPEGFTGALFICFDLLLDGIKKRFEEYDATCARNQVKANKRWHPDVALADDPPAKADADASADAPQDAPRDAAVVSDVPQDVPRDTAPVSDIPQSMPRDAGVASGILQGMPRDTAGPSDACRNMPDDANRNSNRNSNSKSNSNRNSNTAMKSRPGSVLSFLLTGEDGEPIVIHGKS